MKNILSAIKFTLACILLFAVIYPLIILAVAHLAPNKGRGNILEVNGKIVGFQNVGQSFTNINYFWGRPSAVNYNAAGSGGSNKGPSNPEYLKGVQSRIDSFLVHHPYLKKEQIPSEMVTASGSGLDPDISPLSAMIQVKRIARARNISEDKISALVHKQTQTPLFGLFGPPKVNVLELNIALDNIK